MSDKKTSKEKNLNNDAIFAKELVKGLESTTLLIQSLLEDIKDNSELIGSLKAEVEDMNSQLKIMEAIVRGGPSSKSLLTRFAVLEKDVEHILKELEHRQLQEQWEDTVKKVGEAKEKADTEKTKIWITAIISLISAIIAAVATYFSK